MGVIPIKRLTVHMNVTTLHKCKENVCFRLMEIKDDSYDPLYAFSERR